MMSDQSGSRQRSGQERARFVILRWRNQKPTGEKGQLAFITGGASGAGLGQAKVLGRAGARICIADVRADAIDAALADLKAEGIEAHGIVLDIMDRAAYAKAADEVEAVFGSAPTILSNTAGVNSFGPIEKTTYDDFDWIVGVNLGGVINGMVTFVPRMIASGKRGHIVTVSSLGGFMGSAMAGPYSVVTPANIKSNIAEASKLRPTQFGASGYVENESSIASLQSIHQHGMEPEQLGQAIKKGIEENALYIIPYPETRDGLKQRFDAILDSVPPVESDPEGARIRSEALANWAADRSRVFAEGKKEQA